MLRWRLLLGTIFIAAIVGLCWLDYHATQPGIWFLPLALVLSVLASQEVLGLLAERDLRPLPSVVYLGNLLIVASNFVPILRGQIAPNDWGLWAFAVMIPAAFIGEMRRYTQPGGVMVRVALAIFALAYVGVLLTAVVQLRYLLGPKLGMVSLVSLIAVVKMGDIGAYTVGRLFGRTKLAPVLSPGKTIEGAAGGLLFACLGSYLVLNGLLPALAPQLRPVWWAGLVFGISVGIAGMLGDLAESLFKRDVGRKDSSNWLPGFGGVLDLLDSILFAAPVAYVVWRVLVGWGAIDGFVAPSAL
jgi:phosphatidate cytidylyltransferase